MPLEQLEALNMEIGRNEAETDATYFDGLLAPAFVMRRANKERALIDPRRSSTRSARQRRSPAIPGLPRSRSSAASARS
jgi:hypothetical protein